MRFPLVRPLACLAALTFVVSARADELAEKGRALLNAHKHCVVTVRVVIKVQFSVPSVGTQEQEQKSEITGTVIDPSGLTVLALSTADPTSRLENMIGDDDRAQGLNMKVQVTDLKILTQDGSEISGQIVLRDRDLDLAFVRPTEPLKEPVPAIDFTNSAVPEVLDPIVTLNRLGRVAGREYAVSIERINSIIRRPRTYYIMGHDPTRTDLGSPALSLDGKVIGLCVLRTIKADRDSGGFGMFGGSDSAMAVIVPAEDILEIAKQAPEAGAEVKELGSGEAAESATEEPAPEPGESGEGAAPDEPTAEAPAGGEQ